MKKLYVIQKYVIAKSIHEALKNEKTVKPDEVWLEDSWKKSNIPNTLAKKKIGFKR